MLDAVSPIFTNPLKWDWRFWKWKSKWGGPDDTETDPHYRLMLAYKDAPNWWYLAVLLISIGVGLGVLYANNSTLPWWGFLISCLLSFICILFFGAQYGITGYDLNLQSIIQMIGGYLHPGRPVANMYFVLFGYNSVLQGELLLRDLKFAQYAHLAPRTTFVMQMVEFEYKHEQARRKANPCIVWYDHWQYLLLHYHGLCDYQPTGNSYFD